MYSIFGTLSYLMQPNVFKVPNEYIDSKEWILLNWKLCGS